MFEKLSNQLDVGILAQRGQVVPFELPAEELARLAQVTQGVVSAARGELRFSLLASRWPQCELAVTVSVALICQRTLASFNYPLTVEVTLVFADEDDVIDFIDEQEVLSIEEMKENPRVWIEDSLLLALPLVPVQPGTHPVEYESGVLAEEKVEKTNPFATLKAMMQKE